MKLINQYSFMSFQQFTLSWGLKMFVKKFIITSFFVSIALLSINNTNSMERNTKENTITVKKIGNLTNYYAEIISYAEIIQLKTLTNIPNDKLIENIFDTINTNWRYVDNNTSKCECTSSWFVKDIQTTQGNISAILWNELKEPSLQNALNEILNTQLSMECANAAKFCRLKLITDLLEEEGTKALISHMKKLDKLSPFDFLNKLSWTFFEKENGEMEVGKIYFFPFVNHPTYPQINPHGFSSNYNVVRLFDCKYLGFCPDFFKESKTFSEMELFLFSELTKNKNTVDFSTFQKERKKYQEQCGYYYINLEKLAYFKLNGEFMGKI